MIARPHICLRCQSRLARRSTPARNQIAFQSTDARPQRSRIIPDDYDQDEDRFHHTRRPLRLSRRPLGGPNHISQHPLGKLYGYTGQQLRENRERLSVDVLGEAAEVIVLRDSKISNYSHTIEENVETRKGIDILAKLDEERGLVGWEEVETNIDEFRPKEDEEPQTTLEFGQLLTDLQSGFTVAQLARYLQAHGQKDKKAPKLSSTSLIQRISPWIPGVSESDSHLDQDELRGYDLQSYTSKQRLVLRVLRECWKLQLPFVEEGVGQIEVELKPGDLDLLIKGSSSALSAIQSKHIVEREEMLELFKSNDAKRSRNAIRITTTRIKSYAIIRDIEQTLKGIHRIQISLRHLIPIPKNGEKSDFRKWIDTHFDDSVIEEVSRLTNTDIQKTTSGLLSISSVEPYTDLLSNRTDVARRLLLASCTLSDRETSWVGCKELPNAADRILVKYPQTEGLSWRDRLRKWTRWTTPILKEAESKDEIVQKLEEGKKPEESLSPVFHHSKSREPHDAEISTLSDTTADKPPTGEPQSIEPPKLSAQDATYWDGPEDIGVESSAIMGSVLHNQPPSTTSTEPSQSNPLFADAICSFSTAVPNISQILTATLPSKIRPTESVVMRFLPNPIDLSSTNKNPMGSDGVSAFPPIEIRFDVYSETKALRLWDIRAVLSVENSDLMLPDSPIDIRFQQRTTSTLRGHRLPPGLSDFFDKTNLSLDFLRGGLNTPPSLIIPIASHLCKPPGSELLGQGKNDADTQDVDYLFAGLEIQKTITMDFEGWRLLYTSIEAGKAGGRRGQLWLWPVRTNKCDDPSKDTELAFLESAFRLTDGSYTPAKIRRLKQTFMRKVTATALAEGRSVDRIFKNVGRRPSDFELDLQGADFEKAEAKSHYFARRVRITYEGERDVEGFEDETEEALSDDVDEAAKEEGLDHNRV